MSDTTEVVYNIRHDREFEMVTQVKDAHVPRIGEHVILPMEATRCRWKVRDVNWHHNGKVFVELEQP